MIHRKLVVAVAAILVAAGPVYAAVQQPAAKGKAPAPAAKGAAPKTAAPASPAAPAGPTDAEREAQARSVMDPGVELQLTKAQQIASSGIQQTLRGRMAAAAKQRLTLTAEPGTYVISGYCEDACSNLDFRLLGAEDAVIGGDELPDKTPQVQATVAAKASFLLEVGMTACAREACAWAVQISKRP